MPRAPSGPSSEGPSPTCKYGFAVRPLIIKVAARGRPAGAKIDYERRRSRARKIRSVGSLSPPRGRGRPARVPSARPRPGVSRSALPLPVLSGRRSAVGSAPTAGRRANSGSADLAPRGASRVLDADARVSSVFERSAASVLRARDGSRTPPGPQSNLTTESGVRRLSAGRSPGEAVVNVVERRARLPSNRSETRVPRGRSPLTRRRPAARPLSSLRREAPRQLSG